MKNLIGLIDAICDVYDRLDLVPLANGTTFCNVGVSAVLEAMGSDEFKGKTADEIMQYVPLNANWVKSSIDQVQDLANQGTYVLCGLESSKLGESHGHVTVIRPGNPVFSGKWGKVPRCLNIGSENFIARARRGPLMGSPCGINESFVPMPDFYAWSLSL